MKRREPTWRVDVRRMVARYPTLKKELEDIRTQSLAANYTGMSGGSDVSRTTESIALRELPPNDMREYEAVDNALEITGNYSNGKQRMSFIRQFYWRNNVGMDTICQDIHISRQTAYFWNGEFLRLVYAFYRKSKKGTE